jgi:hypothetical protein
MSIIKQEYDLTEKEKAIFLACLKDSAINENNGKISFLDKENLKDHINKLILEKKFIDVNQIIKSAKNINVCDSSAEISSKSFRIPIEPYSKLLLISSMNGEEPLSESIKRVIQPMLNSVIEELRKTPGINVNKLNLIEMLLNDWVNKTSTARDIWSPHFDFTFDKFEDNLIKRYVQIILRSESLEYGLDPSMMDMFIDMVSKPTFIVSFSLVLKPYKGNLNISLKADYSYGIDNETGSTVLDDFYANAIKDYGSEQADKFCTIVERLFDVEEINLGNYVLNFNDGELFINGINLNEERAFIRLVYEKLSEYSYQIYVPLQTGCGHESVDEINDLVKVFYLSLLPSDFEEDFYTQELKDALFNNNYNEALKFSEALEIHEVIDKLSAVICDTFKKLTKESKVVTIGIPNALLNLLDLAKGKESYKNFISKAIEKYWENNKFQGGRE